MIGLIIYLVLGFIFTAICVRVRARIVTRITPSYIISILLTYCLAIFFWPVFLVLAVLEYREGE